ncbi:hypothetical protein KIL84_013160 [Mauremys mutica]|uniref:Uncharacterized protein n=1 Tax=Mauremys mutica TaxID=74926 RepID=A0A9D4AU30_9SAUR|nr:hypothetical protein KIL84_013160 [Mauremys mutica]
MTLFAPCKQLASCTEQIVPTLTSPEETTGPSRDAPQIKAEHILGPAVSAYHTALRQNGVELWAALQRTLSHVRPVGVRAKATPHRSCL